MNHSLRMAELLCTRLCHDLTGPIGAVNNGAEFLSEDAGNVQGQAVELVVSSAFSAVSRLQFYRVAYGNVKDGGEANLSEKKKQALDFFVGSKVTFDWPDTETEASGVSVSLKMARLIFNLLIVANAVLIRGGVIAVRVRQSGEGGRHISIAAQNEHLKWDPEIAKILESGCAPEQLTPKNVQLQLTHDFIKELQVNLSCQVSAGEVIFDLVQSPAAV